MTPEELERLREDRYWSWWLWHEKVGVLMETLEADRDANLLPQGLLLNAAWEAACRADQKFWQAKKEFEQ